jgi:hypothetical protein
VAKPPAAPSPQAAEPVDPVVEARWRMFQQASARRYPNAERARIEQRLDNLLAKGAWPARVLFLTRSGLWEPRLKQGLGAESAKASGLFSYARAGARPTVQPKALFDQAWYLRNNPEIEGSPGSPLVHYLIEGDRNLRSPHPLFDLQGYRARHAVKIAASRLTALQHFIFAGAREGFDPHPLFDVTFYVGQCAEVARTGENPLVHYLRKGWREGLDPHPLFSGERYLERNPAAPRDVAPLLHFVSLGALERR